MKAAPVRSKTEVPASHLIVSRASKDTTNFALMRQRANASSVVERLGTLQKMADKSQTMQRYPATNGTPGAWMLNAQTYLTHGTAAQQFLDPAGAPQALPSAPAWFAMGSRFSAHAGSRGGNAVTHLHNYEVTANTNLLAFADVDDISLYLQANGFPATDVNGVTEANQILGLNAGALGYYVHEDAVRGEPEIILFAAGMANLAMRFRSELDSQEPPAFGDDMELEGRRKLKGGGKVHHTANVDDLVDFRTEGDHRDGRARSGSI